MDRKLRISFACIAVLSVAVFCAQRGEQAILTQNVATSGSWSLVQEVIGRSADADDVSCVTTTCTVTVASTGSNHGATIDYFDINGSGITISSVTGGCTAGWVVQSSSHLGSGTYGDFNAATCTQTASGATSVAVVLSSAPSQTEVGYHEWAWGGSSISTLGTPGGTNVNSSSSSSQTGVALTCSGTVVVVQFINLSTGVATGVSSPYTGFTTTETGHSGNNLFNAHAYVLNQTSCSAPTWTSGTATSAGLAISLKGS